MARPPLKVPDKADDKEQSERFIKTAREHEADESKDALDRAFRRITSANVSDVKKSQRKR